MVQRLIAHWPASINAAFTESVFVGAWTLRDALQLKHDADSEVELARVEGDRFTLFSTKSPLHTGETGLVHSTGDDIAIAFRGYVVAPPLHSYSAPATIVNYWRRPPARHNGAFAAAVIDRGRSELRLIVDALGIEPLYYRKVAGCVLFATNPRYLSMPNDAVDLIAWLARIESGFIPSDRALTQGVRRVPAGAELVFSEVGEDLRYWYSAADFPSGTRPVTEASLQETEECFRACLKRTLAVQNGSLTLPLSSGHDSRRILAALIDEQADFHAMTVRVRQKEHRDLDATYAAAMAADLGFSHEILEFAGEDQYGRDSLDRLLLTDYETAAHTWVMRFMSALPKSPSVLVDGLLGDILGNPGYRMSGMYESTDKDLQLMLDADVTNAHGRYLNRAIWPDSRALREEVSAYLKPFMGKRNMAEFAFILLRQRRMTALWSHQLLPAGYVAVCPYLDLEYLELLFSYQPEGKHAMVFQRACLEKFWPELAKYPGNRDIPGYLRPGNPRWADRLELQHYRNLQRDITALDRQDAFQTYFGEAGRLLYRLSQSSNYVARRWDWLLTPVTELVHRQETQRPVWQLA